MKEIENWNHTDTSLTFPTHPFTALNYAWFSLAKNMVSWEYELLHLKVEQLWELQNNYKK